MDRRIQTLLEARTNVDAILITSYANRRYLSGFTGSSGILLLGADLRLLITDSRYITQAKEEAPLFTVIQATDPAQKLGELFKDRPSGKLGFEAEDLTYAQYEKFAKALPWALLPLEGLSCSRAVKDAGEIEKIAKAARIGDLAFANLLSKLQVGMTELEAVAELEYQMRRLGARCAAFPTIIASGPKSALPHAQPDSRLIQRGDLVVIDCGANYQGYCSDMTRTVVVGQEPTAKMQQIYQLVLQAQLVGLRAVRQGMGVRELDATVRSIIEAAGYGFAFGHGLGHGVGLEIHEEPRLSPKGEGQLTSGMIVTVEPGIYLPGWGGVRIEDLVLVEETGARVLSKTGKDLVAVG